MFCPTFDSVFFCLLATSRKKTNDQILIKILAKIYCWTRKSPLYLRSCADLDLNVGIFYIEIFTIVG